MTADVQQLYALLLNRNAGETLFETETRGQAKNGTELIKDCPFCQKEGHLYVSTEKPLYHCFHCGESGDWIDYLQKTKGWTFPEALRFLAEKAGIQLSESDGKEHRAEIRKSSVFETAMEKFRKDLFEPIGKSDLAYLKNERGLSEEEIGASKIGSYTDRDGLLSLLKEKAFTKEEIDQSGLFQKDIGRTHTVVLEWKYASNQTSGLLFRSTLSTEKLKEKHLPKYLFTPAMKKGHSFIGLDIVRKHRCKTCLIVEGPFDALKWNMSEVGYSPAVAVGGTSISEYQVKTLEDAGITAVFLAFDNDEAGRAATEKVLRSSLFNPKMTLSVLTFDKGKDVDEALRLRANFHEKAWSVWLIEKAFSEVTKNKESIGFRTALTESVRLLSDIDSPFERSLSKNRLEELSGLTQEELAEEETRFSSTKKEEALLEELKHLKNDISAVIDTKNTREATSVVKEGLHRIEKTEQTDIQDSYSLEQYLKDCKETPEGLRTGFDDLDKLIRIPQGTVTVIAGRPRHGKTTMMMNTALRMSDLYPDRSFLFFSYEIPRRVLSTMIIMSLARFEQFDRDGTPNFDRYEKYMKRQSGNVPEIEDAKRRFRELCSSGRLLLFDRSYSHEQLKRTIETLSEQMTIGAVFVDYLQKIPLDEQKAVFQRYVEVKKASESVRQAAVSCNIPIIAGAQLGRDSAPKQKPNANSKKGADSLPRPRLEQMRESGDIEQDASLIIALFNLKAEMEDQKIAFGETTDELELHILKNRFGKSNTSCNVRFQGRTFSVDDIANCPSDQNDRY